MKKFLYFMPLIIMTSLCGCSNQSNVVIDKQEILEEQATTEPIESDVIVESIEKTTSAMTPEEIEQLIDQKVEQKVEQKIAQMNIKDGKDGINGKDGADGVGIAGVTVDENGNLIVALTNGVIANVGHVKGDKGDKGDQGSSSDSSSYVTKEEVEAIASANIAKAAEAEKAAAKAAAAQTGSIIINCKDGRCLVTQAQLNTIHATWDFAGDAIGMAGHHTISELEAVIGPVTRL